ncbi:MAG: hypothetical protein RL660_2086 [Bacteroidota bacterium]|jgi:hypothetical protein
MKKVVLSILALCAVALATNAQISVTTGALTYVQDFNTLADTNISTPVSIALQGWSINERGTSAQVDNKYKSDNGGSNSGNAYSYGSSGATERALGSLASGSCKASFGASFQNNTGSQIDSVVITYYAEQWRAGGDTTNIVDTLYFGYAVSPNMPAAIDSDFTAFTQDATLSATSSASTPAGMTDGNTAAFRKLVTKKIAITIPQNGFFTMKWVDVNSAGNDDAIAIDDISVAFIMQGGNPITPPAVVSRTPGDGATNVSDMTTSISVTFDQAITIGTTGSILVKNLTDGTNTTITLPSAQVTASGNTATISGLTLVCNKDYAVQYGGACFTANGLSAPTISNNTDWNFTTVFCTGINDVAKGLNCQLLTDGTRYVLQTPEMSGNYVVCNAQGVVVNKGNINSTTTSLNCNTLAPGVYMVRVSQAGKLGILQFVVL